MTGAPRSIGADGRFTLLEHISSGANEVWLARDERLSDEKRHARTVVRIVTATDSRECDELRRAGARLCRVRSTGIPAAIDHGETDDGRLYLVHEQHPASASIIGPSSLTMTFVESVARSAQMLHRHGVWAAPAQSDDLRIDEAGQPSLLPGWESMPGASIGTDLIWLGTLVRRIDDASRDLRHIADLCARGAQEDGYDSAEAVADDLARVQARRPLTGQSVSPVRHAHLWAQRNPILSMACLAIVIGFAIGLPILIRNLGAIDSRRQQLAYIEAILAFMAAHPNLEAEHVDELWPFEWLYGRRFYAEGIAAPTVWGNRIATARSLLAGLEENELQALAIGTALAQWLLQDGDTAAAQALLHDSAPQWRSMLDAGDAWHERIEVLEQCVVVQQVEALGTEVSRENRNRLVEAIAILADFDNKHSATPTMLGISTQRLANDHLHRAAPAVDDVESLERARENLKLIEPD